MDPPPPSASGIPISESFFVSRLIDTSTCSCDTRCDISASQLINHLFAQPVSVLCYVNTCFAAVLLYVLCRLDVELFFTIPQAYTKRCAAFS